MANLGPLWPEEWGPSGEVDSIVDTVVGGSGTEEHLEGDSVETVGRGNERLEAATLLRFAPSCVQRSGAVTVSQNEKRGG